MKKVLITGFEPFGDDLSNPSYEALKLLKDVYEDIQLVKKEIPVTFNKSIEQLKSAIDAHQPNAIICIGQAGGRYSITPEKVAINLNDARIPDNEGNCPVDEPIFEEGKNAYFSSLPIRKMVYSMRQKNIPSDISYTAGTYVCNHLMYGLLYLIEKKYPNKIGGFIHVPYASYQVIEKKNTPSMSLEEIAKGIEICVKTVFDEEINESFGVTH